MNDYRRFTSTTGPRAIVTHAVFQSTDSILSHGATTLGVSII